MRRLLLCCSAALVVGCTKSDDHGGMDSTAMATPAAMPQQLALADIAGTWDMRVMPAGSDSTVLTFSMMAGTDTTGWAFQFADREPVPVRVISVAGDSVVTEAGPYESALRSGVQVSTRSVMRLDGGMLVGTTTAHYATGGADSVITLRSEGTRAP